MENDITAAHHIHFIGISGIGVSALAGILLKQGKKITGSDSEISSLAQKLTREGAIIFEGHSSAHLSFLPDLVIYSLAIPQDNPELSYAHRKKIPVISYPEAIGQLTRKFFTIAVCGTHGKTTITAMIAKTLIEHDFDPTVIVGTTLKELVGRNFRLGKKRRLLLLEACEYQRAFLHYKPQIILLHTLDPDHLDYYRDFEEYQRAFQDFVRKLPPHGYFFGNLDDEDVHEIYKTLQKNKFPPHNIFSYATSYSAVDFYLHGHELFHKNAKVGELHLKIPGAHNRTNALATFSLCFQLGIAAKDILQSLNHYEGASRRFEMKGNIGRCLLIDDYAHHPAEIRATLEAAREKFPKEKICVVFQPHQYSRTKKLLKEFGPSFQKADAVIIPNIYASRDTKEDQKAVSPQRLVQEIQKYHRQVCYGNGFDKTTELLRKNAKKFDVIFTMGAGDVWRVGNRLLRA